MDQTLYLVLGISSEGISSFPSSTGSCILYATTNSDPAAFNLGLNVPASSTPPSGNITEIPPISGDFPTNPPLISLD